MDVGLGARIKQAREEASLSQAECARRAGLPDSRTLWRIETGRSEPSVDAVKRIAEVIGVTTDSLIVGEPTEATLEADDSPRAYTRAGDAPPADGTAAVRRPLFPERAESAADAQLERVGVRLPKDAS